MATVRHSLVSTLFGAIVAFALVALAPQDARATTITLSHYSSKPAVAPEVLDATLSFAVAGDQLMLTLTNETTAPDRYRINGIWWNGAANVMAVSLASATHSAFGDVTAAWAPVERRTKAADFGRFDFALTASQRTRGSLLGSGESITFALTIFGSGPFDAEDFVDPNRRGMTGAARFVHGPIGRRKAFGASDTSLTPIPEPGTAALLGSGLLGMALAARRRSADH